MSSLQELLAQKAAIDRQISDARHQERNEAVAKVRALMAEHGLTATDLVVGKAATSTRGPASAAAPVKKVAAKYRDPASGQTWTGRGLKPKWLAAALGTGKQLADFAI